MSVKTSGVMYSIGNKHIAMAFFLLSACIIILVFISFYQKKTNGVCVSKKRLDGKTVLVTGGTAGMGLKIASELAKRGAKTIIASPFEEEGTLAKNEIIKSTENHNVFFKHLDLGSLASVRKFTTEIINEEDRLDILVNNAGVGIVDNEETLDGMGYLMQVNYFGSFLLTLLLLPVLRETGTPSNPSRIINTSSCIHWIGTVDLDKMKGTRSLLNRLSLIKIYGNSKLCVILFSNELGRRLLGKDVVVNTIDPGAVATRIFLSFDKYVGYICILLTNIFFKTVWEGAQTALHVALDEKAGKISGMFYRNCKLSTSRSIANDEELAKKLWEESMRLTKMSNMELEYCIKGKKE